MWLVYGQILLDWRLILSVAYTLGRCVMLYWCFEGWAMVKFHCLSWHCSVKRVWWGKLFSLFVLLGVPGIWIPKVGIRLIFSIVLGVDWIMPWGILGAWISKILSGCNLLVAFFGWLQSRPSQWRCGVLEERVWDASRASLLKGGFLYALYTLLALLFGAL